jgi:putative DNA primase/helicase
VSDLGITISEDGPIEQRRPCPRCARSGHDDALGVNRVNGVFHCFRCGWAGKFETGQTRSATVINVDDAARADRVRRRLRETWANSVGLDLYRAWPVYTYFRARGLERALDEDLPDLRFHAALDYYDNATRQSLGRYPALVAMFRDGTGKPVSLHATYLRRDGKGKAPVASPRKILGTMASGATRGGAIRLHYPRGGKLGIAEGIETALSLHLLSGMIPVWAAYSSGNLMAVRIPQYLTVLKIAVDKDLSGVGERAATALASRMRRRRKTIDLHLVYPDRPAPSDLNDQLLEQPRVVKENSDDDNF